MEASKVPFIAEYDPSATIRPLKQYRPVSVRPWTLSLFLAATGICFGLLLAVCLVEKEPTPIAKRDIGHLQDRSLLHERQDETSTTVDASAILSLASVVVSAVATIAEICTTTVYVTVVTCVAQTEAGYTCSYTATTTFPTTEPTGSCDVETSTLFSFDTGNLLSLTFPDSTTSSDSPSPEATSPAVEATPYTAPTVQATPTSEAAAPGASLESSSSTYLTTSPTAFLSLEPSSTDDPTSSESETIPSPVTSVFLSLAPANTDDSISSESVLLTSMTSSALLSLEPANTVESISSESGTITATTDSTALLDLGPASVSESKTVYYSTSALLSLDPQDTETTETAAGPALTSLLTLTPQSITLVETIANTVVNTVTELLSLTSQGTTIMQYVTQTKTVQTTTLITLTSQATPVVQTSTLSTLTPLARPSITSSASFTLPTETEIVSDDPSSTTISSSPASSSTLTGWQDPVPNEDLVLIKVKFENWYYFLAIYLPKIIAVIMATLWSIIFAGLKLMEPFYHLSANTGVYASGSMFGNYLASELNLPSLSATFHGQWVLLLGGAVLVGWAAIVALSSESMMIISTATCSNADVPSFRCAPGWAVSRPILYALMGIVGLVFVLILVLILLLGRRKRTGVFTNPGSIATMAELLGNPLVMEDLQAIKPSSSSREVKMFLGDNRYKLGFYDSSTGKESFFSSSSNSEQRWGLVKLDQVPSSRSLASGRQIDYGAVLNPGIMSTEESKANRMRRIFQILFDLIMLLIALCVFGLVIGYYFASGSTPFNNFFNRGAFGPRFVLTSLALILSVGLRRTCQEMMVMAPYRTMAKAFQTQSGVMARRSILAPTPRTPWTAVYRSLSLRHFMITLVAISAILADVLIIAVSGVPFSSGQTLISYRVAVYTSLCISGITILTLVVVMIYNRTSAGGTRKLPRSPDTLIGVWLYLCHSRLVTNKQSFEDEYESPLDDEGLRAKYDGYHCGFARVLGEDGVHRWTVDSAMVLRSAGLGKTQHRYQEDQRPHPRLQDAASNQQRPGPYEASATPIENPYGHYPPRDMSMQRNPVSASQQPDQQHPYHRNGVPFYEAQAKSPTTQAPAPRFEEVRPQRHSVQAHHTTQTYQPPPQQQAESTLHEALAQWEYEQEYFNTRRLSAGSSEYSRWTNDGRSRYKYG